MRIHLLKGFRLKIVHKLILISVFDILLVALTGFFAYRNLDLVVSKLRFMEIADDLNASFLEMRLSEKNFFLYADKTALPEIDKKLEQSRASINLARDAIVRATGQNNFDQLVTSLDQYARAIRGARGLDPGRQEVQSRIRELGQKLRDVSSQITHLERNNLNELVSDSRTGLFSSLLLIACSAIGIRLISYRVLHYLKDIELVAQSISEGNFSKVETEARDDELGSVIKAINSMSEELRSREEIVLQSKKLASIGILTAGVAHELGNPLNNISMLSQAYVELYDTLSREDRIDFMNKVEEESQRIKEIVKNLLDFAKPKEPDLKEADINHIINKGIRLVHNMTCVCNVEAQIFLQDGLPSVLVDEHQVLEVLVNLLTNGIQALPPGGKLFVASRLGEGGRCVEIEVVDFGKGIPHELLPYVFDPFFTTKGSNGTGLGLFVSYGIIKNHKGNISVSSDPENGTCFRIELPVLDS